MSMKIAFQKNIMVSKESGQLPKLHLKSFLSEMKIRRKAVGNTWGLITDDAAFRKAWIEKRNLALLSDEEIYALCPDYYR